jgi:hypothetical protein
MMQFKAFKPEGLNKIAGAMGYKGDMSKFQDFIEQDPARMARMNMFTQAAQQMARGGMVKMQTGGFVAFTQGNQTQSAASKGAGGNTITGGVAAGDPSATAQNTPAPLDIGQETTNRMFNPALPTGGVVNVAATPLAKEQLLDTGTGQLTGQPVALQTAVANTAQATIPQQQQANLMQAQQAAPAVDAAVGAVQASQANPQDPRAQVTAAQQTASSVGNLQAAQGNAILMNNPQQRQIQAGELISGTGVDATKAAQATAQTQAAAATAQPSTQALVQTQLANLANQFQGTNPPAWAAGAIRTANAQMAARGLGASSLAGQAIVQAAMEASLPIAQADAQIISSFEAQNLSNRQQSAMLAAEQRAKFLGQEFDQTFQTKVQNAARVADVANMNFTAEQQVALENSRIANTMNLNNLSNQQAMVMAEAAALSQLDVSNLNNRQQAAAQNANSFLQVDMANLSNNQQTELFKGQQRIQSLFTDQAAENASRQLNASSQNQVDQFFASLANQASQFNAAQQNGQAQFNAGQINTVERFNAELNNQRDQFNAQNQLAISQNNAQWRREIATADTAATNRANELNASAIIDVSKQAYDNLWNYYSDTMEWAWTSAENELNRYADMAIATLNADERAKVASQNAKTAAGSAVGGLIGTLGSAFISAKFCWVGREVYGKSDPRWFIFRMWVRHEAPAWFRDIYGKHGKAYAEFISNKPLLKWVTKKLMDIIVERKELKSATC